MQAVNVAMLTRTISVPMDIGSTEVPVHVLYPRKAAMTEMGLFHIIHWKWALSWQWQCSECIVPRYVVHLVQEMTSQLAITVVAVTVIKS